MLKIRLTNPKIKYIRIFSGVFGVYLLLISIYGEIINPYLENPQYSWMKNFSYETSELDKRFLKKGLSESFLQDLMDFSNSNAIYSTDINKFLIKKEDNWILYLMGKFDHRVAKFSAELPDKYKMNGEYSKWILNQVLYKYLPKEFVDRPKIGFQAPVAEWLRWPLREWVDALLDDRRIRDEGFFYPEVIQRTWREHLSKKRNRQFKLWNILMFQAWLEHEKGHPSKLVAT